MSKALRIFFIALPLWGTSCQFWQTDTDTMPIEKEEKISHYVLHQNASDSLVYQQDTLFLTEHDSFNISSPLTAKIILSYPVFDSTYSPIKDSIRTLVKYVLRQEKDDDLAYPTAQDRMISFIKEFKEFDEEMQSFGLMTGPKWINTVHIHILTNTPDVIAIRVNELEFMGGAHPNDAVSFHNLEVINGKKITLPQLFDTSYQASFINLIESTFLQTINQKSDTSLHQNKLMFEEGFFPLPAQFALLDTGVLFHYNAYELGAFAYGDVSFSIPYDSLHYYFLENAPILLDTFYYDQNTLMPI
jgi:hypothetical protein